MADVEKIAGGGPEIESSMGETHELPSKAVGIENADIGLALFQQSQQYDTAQLEIDAIKVRRKLDFIVLPMVYHTLSLPLQI